MNTSRIDRMYINGLVGNQCGSIRILPSTCFSDHSPTMLVVDGERRGSLSLQIPKSVQTDDGIADQIEQLWL